jgi:SAM-dependent methyltransferase
MSEHDHAHHDHTHDARIELDDDRWSAAFWDERYGSSPTIWSGHVNAVLATEASELRPRTALDVGCGEGGDAIWLAERGWQVVGIDVSQVAVDRATARATTEGVSGRVTFEQRDLMSWAPPAAAYDLVTACFIHLPPGPRLEVYAGIAAAVAPGGTLLVAAHSPLDIGVVPRPPDPDLFFTAEELAADLGPEWDVVTAEARARPGTHPDGHDVVLHDTVLRALRRG